MPDKELSLIEHLTELRKRLIYCLIWFLLVVIIVSPFVKYILVFLRLPAKSIIEKLAFFSPQEVAIAYIKIAVFSSLVLSLPIILYQIWQFILPALEEKHKKYIFSFIFWVTFAFLVGASFGYFFLVPISLKFLISLGADDVVAVISIKNYLSFVLILILGCGLVFQTPILIWILAKLKIVNSMFLRTKRKYAIGVILILAAIITPTTDPFTMFLLAIPMIILYEISIWISFFVGSKTKALERQSESS